MSGRPSRPSARTQSTSRRAWKYHQESRTQRSFASCLPPSMPEAPVTHRFGLRDPDARGYYGAFGGRFVPETLVAPVEALERAYLEARTDDGFRATLDDLLQHYVGRPTP